MNRRQAIAAGAALALAPMLGHAAQAAPRLHRIGMARMRFGAVPAGIRLGDLIEWVNGDIVPHTATARNGAFDVDLPAGASRRMRASRAGTFAFYCRYHPAMRGSLTVAE